MDLELENTRGDYALNMREKSTKIDFDTDKSNMDLSMNIDIDSIVNELNSVDDEDDFADLFGCGVGGKDDLFDSEQIEVEDMLFKTAVLSNLLADEEDEAGEENTSDEQADLDENQKNELDKEYAPTEIKDNAQANDTKTEGFDNLDNVADNGTQVNDSDVDSSEGEASDNPDNGAQVNDPDVDSSEGDLNDECDETVYDEKGFDYAEENLTDTEGGGQSGEESDGASRGNGGDGEGGPVKHKILRKVLNAAVWVFVCALATMCLLLIYGRICYSFYIVIGESMYPSLTSGQIVCTSVYEKDIGIGSVIVIDSSEISDKEYFIKRIVATEGDALWAEDGFIHVIHYGVELVIDNIDGVKLEPIEDSRLLLLAEYSEMKPLIIGEGEFFFMGDNRNNSNDSRNPDIGSQSTDKIVGAITDDFPMWYYKILMAKESVIEFFVNGWKGIGN
ncbi:MAG: signal peptidase I [Clostridia bacterium]|nr:signal peptidase I [Clostridia bacterium]